LRPDDQRRETPQTTQQGATGIIRKPQVRDPYQENIDTTTPQGELIFTVMASLAQFERALISERVKAGMARAKAQGKRISRAPIPRGVQVRIADLYRQGVSIHQMSKKLGIGYSTAWNYG
jgi:DNA invertase Pin-like site-specific DNA recombinase